MSQQGSTDGRVAEELEAARAAFARGDWAEARTRFEAALAGRPGAEAHEGRARAALAQFDLPAVLESHAEAFRLRAESGDVRGMARMAIANAWGAMTVHLDHAVCVGWLERARELLRDQPEGPEHGWLALREADLVHGRRRELAHALQRAREAIEIGRRHGDADLEIEALALEGHLVLKLGRVAEGLRALDLAAARALHDPVADTLTTGNVLCQVMSACEEVHDFERAEQWLRSLDQYHARRPLPLLEGLCRSHVAHLQMERGRFEDAERALAGRDCSSPYSALQLSVQWGELRLRQGRLDEAEARFSRVPQLRAAQLGLAAVAMERGDLLTARDQVERQLRSAPKHAFVDRAPGLALLARVRIALGDVEGAAEAAEGVWEAAESAGTAGLRITALRARAEVEAAQGELDCARRDLEDAVDTAARTGLPLEVAESRLALSRVLGQLGRSEAAAREAKAAHALFVKLGAGRRAEEAARRERACSGGAVEAPAGKLPLSERELEVLRLVADGLANKEIAARLHLSEHTVKRHVANILERLGLPSRAAAVAYVARAGGL